MGVDQEELGTTLAREEAALVAAPSREMVGDTIERIPGQEMGVAHMGDLHRGAALHQPDIRALEPAVDLAARGLHMGVQSQEDHIREMVAHQLPHSQWRMGRACQEAMKQPGGYWRMQS